MLEKVIAQKDAKILACQPVCGLLDRVRCTKLFGLKNVR